jgi:hypothetical protein
LEVGSQSRLLRHLLSKRLGWAVLSFLFALWPLQAEQVVFSKIMYHPRGDKPEYLEIFNNTSNPFDMAKWRMVGGVNYDFPDFASNAPLASFLRPFERIVLSETTPPGRAKLMPFQRGCEFLVPGLAN